MMVFVYKIPMLSSTKRSLYCNRKKIYVYLEMFAFDRASIWIFIAFSNNESLRLKSHTLPPCNCISFVLCFKNSYELLQTLFSSIVIAIFSNFKLQYKYTIPILKGTLCYRLLFSADNVDIRYSSTSGITNIIFLLNLLFVICNLH